MPAPKGNKFALGNDGGRPRTYKTPKELQKVIDRYFDEDCWEDVILKDKNGIPIQDADGNLITERMQTQHYTISGLALALGMTSVALRNYEKTPGYEEFFNIVKKARTKIENYAEQKLYSRDSATGAIFTLKVNFGHIEKSIIEQQHTGEIRHTHGTNLENFQQLRHVGEKYEEELKKQLTAGQGVKIIDVNPNEIRKHKHSQVSNRQQDKDRKGKADRVS